MKLLGIGHRRPIARLSRRHVGLAMESRSPRWGCQTFSRALSLSRVAPSEWKVGRRFRRNSEALRPGRSVGVGRGSSAWRVSRRGGDRGLTGFRSVGDVRLPTLPVAQPKRSRLRTASLPYGKTRDARRSFDAVRPASLAAATNPSVAEEALSALYATEIGRGGGCGSTGRRTNRAPASRPTVSKSNAMPRPASTSAMRLTDVSYSATTFGARVYGARIFASP